METTKPLVLVVDDDEAIREITRTALEVFEDCDVITVDGGYAAIEAAQTQPIDLVLLDMMMPELDGLATFERLQADPRTKDIPVILLTAKAQVGPEQPWDGHAVRGVIAKPFSVTTLGADILRILG